MDTKFTTGILLFSALLISNALGLSCYKCLWTGESNEDTSCNDEYSKKDDQLHIFTFETCEKPGAFPVKQIQNSSLITNNSLISSTLTQNTVENSEISEKMACYKVKGSENTKEVLRRGCIVMDSSYGNKCEKIYENHITGDGCYCFTDGCNNASTLSIVKLLQLIGFLTTFIISNVIILNL